MPAKTKAQLERELVETRQQLTALNEKIQGLEAILADHQAGEAHRNELEAALARETALFSDGPVVIFHLKANANPMIQYVSPNISQFGYSQEDFMAGRRRYAYIIFPEDEPYVRKTAHSQQKNLNTQHYQMTYRIACADGSLRWVYDFTRIIRGPGGSPTHYYFYIMDITDRVNALQESQARQELLNAFIEQSYDGIYLADQDRKVLVWNQAVANITGIEAANALETSIIDLLMRLAPNGSKTEYIDHYHKRIVKVFTGDEGQQTSTKDTEIRRVDGTKRIVQSLVFPIHTNKGRLLAGILRDVTELKLAETEARKAHAELELAYDETLQGWAKTLELRHMETRGHSDRVTELTVQLARAVGVNEEQLIHVRRGALLHDIGKMAIPDYILLKPGPLTAEEWVTMRQHPDYAYEYLKEIPFLIPALDIPRYHHERWNGMGYPFGLRGEEIPIAARIFSVIDVWDALGHERVYHPAWPKVEVIKYLREHAGEQFDPQIVDVFIEMVADGKQ